MESLQYLIFTDMGDKYLDYHALKEAWKARASPIEHISWKRVKPVRNATKEILSSTSSQPSDRFLTVSSLDYTGHYTFLDDDDDNYTVSFVDTDVKIEYADRHPGTVKEDDCEDDADAASVSRKYLHFRLNDSTSPITTTASRYLFSVAFDAPNDGSSTSLLEMKAAYKHQMSLRIDEARQCLNLDCFEYKPSCIDIKATGDNAPVPTNRDLERFHGAFHPELNSDGESDDDDDDEIKEWMDKKVKPTKEDKCFSEENITEMSYQALVGNFVHSRCLRMRIPMSTVVGIRLMVSTNPNNVDEVGDIGAVLILEVNECPKNDAFAARMVRSKLQGENAFALTSDWTPGKMASKATRFYFYGNLFELKRTAALLARRCPHIATMFASGSDATNSLKSSVSVEYGKAPSFKETENESHSGDDQDGPPSKKRRAMTTCKQLAMLAPPPLSTWDGKIENSNEVWEAMVAREQDPGKRMMMKLMMNGPEANFDGREVTGLMSTVMGTQTGASRPRGNGDQCCLM